jgi:O-antigen/teichoic acid export membrane protein
MGSMHVYLQKKSGEKMNKFSYKNLLKDSFTFAVGSSGSKVIVFFLIPYYTFYISKDDFGTYDLINTSVNLVFPIITLAIYESTLRFNLEENTDKSSILSNSIIIFVIGSIFTLAASTLSIIIFNLNIMNSISTCLLILLNAFQKILVQYIRGIKKVKLFVINGVIISILTSLMSILLVGVLKLELKGILYASTISIFISNIYLLKFSNLYKMIQVSKIDFSMLKNMLKYSIPLIPNTLSLWITSSSNRFFILFFLGSSSNGLFAVAYKFAAIMTLNNSFVFQAWQIVASEQ